ncbi:MAG: type II toxin-antitoxin system RelE/ParE family toxin [Proteobacteria bacterium]|nr:type II toxin-antitoxin system RelE/ParE family toxin [Pseudomonadota bacterium]
MSNKNKIRLSDLAKQDLLSIFNYTIENWGEEQARNYAQRLSNCFDLLAQSPDIGSQRNNFFKNALSFSVGSHIVFYTKDNDPDSHLEIASILHQSLDLEQHF